MKGALAAVLLLLPLASVAAPDADDTPADLTGFKTYNRKPLVELLHSYGIHIASSMTMPGELDRPAADRTGLTIYAIQFSSGPTKKMPCRLNDWLKGDVLPTMEFVRRGKQFPLVDAATDDPLTYWAATGKCSKAYSY